MKTLKTILQEVISGIKAWVDTNTVHKSGDETIDGTKTFSAPQCYSSNAILFNSSVLPAQNTAPSATINPLRQYVGYGTSYTNSVFIHDTEMRANGRNHYRWTIYSDDHSANAAMWLVYNPDSEYIRYLDLKGSLTPDANNTYHIGTPDYKWKTLNGVNPGALSFPNPDFSKIVDFSTDLNNITKVTATASKFSWTAQITGWMTIVWYVKDLTPPHRAAVYATLSNHDGDGRYHIFGTSFATSTPDYYIYSSFPVVEGVKYWFENSFSNTTTGTVFHAYVLPCLGNV